MSNLPPELYGIDPEETWAYTPTAYRTLPESDRFTLTLRSPDAALDHLMESEDSKIHSAVRKAVPVAIQTMSMLSRRIDAVRKAESNPDKPEDECLSAEEVLARQEALTAWSVAFSEELSKSDRTELMRRVLGFCVVSWKGLKNRNGAEIKIPAASKIIDSLPKGVRLEVFDAIKDGVKVSQEEKASLT